MALNRITADSITDGTVIASDIADNTITLAKLVSGLLPTAIANSAASYANSAFATANSGFITANAAFLQANTPDSTANSAAIYANGAFTKANTAASTGKAIAMSIVFGG